jgi:hypothetical protein
MVNGYLPRLPRQELFAGLGPPMALSACPAMPPIHDKALIHGRFSRWHGFCN